MAEVLYNLAAATNNDQWAKAGDRFTKKRFVNPLASRRDELRPLHVNTHIPQVIAAARRYEISGDMRFHDVADFFFYEVSTARTYVTGGTSNGEAWLAQPRQLAAELKMSVSTAECCCSYNMLKLARHLYTLDRRPALFRLLRARPPQPPHRHHPAQNRPHPVLPLAHPRRLEDLLHRGSIVLVLHRHRRRRVLQAHRQHLLARRRRRVCQPVHSLRAELARKRFRAAPGYPVPRAAADGADGHCGQAGPPRPAPAHSLLARFRSHGES